jgi:hypothetical protein
MSDLWNALQQAIWIAYGSIILWALGLGLAGAIMLVLMAILGRLLSRYLK